MRDIVVGLAAPVYALPVDIFRILGGFVGLWYFLRTLRQTPDFSDPDGLIDHRLSQRLFPPTRLSLFQPGLPGMAFRFAFSLACVAAVCVILGFHTKVAAAYLFVIAVSTYRWNLLVIYVDDAIMHLVFFWLLLLPVGRTLTAQDWIANGSDSVDAWLSATVPGASVRCFIVNMALVYVVAGAYKFTSPMWRNGSALHAILEMPLSRAPDFWRERHCGFLRLFNYAALVLEPLFALMFVLPANSLEKWFLVSSAAVFHLGIIATLKIPFANAAMLGAFPLALRPEIMRLGLDRPPPGVGAEVTPWMPTDMIALALVAALTLMVVWEIGRAGSLLRLPIWRTHLSGFLGNPFYVVLWLVGIVQSYRLFDWIDTRNWHARYEVLQSDVSGGSPRRLDPDTVFPRSLRHLLLQSYLFGNVWMRMDAQQRRALRRTILVRHARRFARRHPDAGEIEVVAITQRVTADNLALERGVRCRLLRFTCRGGAAVVVDVCSTV